MPILKLDDQHEYHIGGNVMWDEQGVLSVVAELAGQMNDELTYPVLIISLITDHDGVIISASGGPDCQGIGGKMLRAVEPLQIIG